jgi:hypothetical protein
MKRILVPTDFAQSSEGAANYALALASKLGMKVTLLHVLEIYQYTTWVQETEIITPVFPIEDMGKLEEVAHHNLEQMIQRLNVSWPNVFIDYKLIKGQFIFDLIAETAYPDSAFVVVSSTSGRDFIEKAKKNFSVLFYESACPLIIVPDNVSYRPVNKIIYATALHESDLLVLQQIINLFNAYLPHISMLHIDQHKPNFGEMLKFLGFQKLVNDQIGYSKIDFETIYSRDIEGRIKERSEKEQTDMLVLVKENKGLLQSLFEASHSLKISKITDIPIILYSEKLAKEGLYENNKA